MKTEMYTSCVLSFITLAVKHISKCSKIKGAAHNRTFNTWAILIPTYSNNITFEAKMLQTFFKIGLLLAPSLAELEEVAFKIVSSRIVFIVANIQCESILNGSEHMRISK